MEGMDTSAHAFYTIGHSTRSVEELVDLLRAGGVQRLVDVRTVPRSRTNPQFNLDAMPAALAPHGVDYLHLASLGGLRGKRRDGPSPNTFWTNTSFRNYADHAMGDAFQAGLTQLRAMGRDQACAVMCSEAVWWRCHRRLIADYLLAAGEQVFHIMDRGKLVPATLTPSARDIGGGVLVYAA